MLRETIRSVLNQTYKDMKIVVLDDASSDGTTEVVASFNDPRLSYIRHERNIGALNNWNYAINCADTEYVNVFHGDDRMFPWMVEKLVTILENNPNAGLAASGGHFYVGGTKIPTKQKKTSGKYYQILDFVKQYAAQADYSIMAPSITIRKKMFDNLRIRYQSDVGPAADAYFVLEANAKGVEMFVTDEPLLEYRRHEASWTNNSGFDKWFDSLSNIEALVQRIIPGTDMSLWGAKYAKWLFETTSTISRLNDIPRQRRLTEAKGWQMSDDDFLMSLLYSFKQIDSGASLQEAKERLRDIFRENGWMFSEATFNKSALRHTVREFIKRIGEGKETYADYRNFRASLAVSGFRIPIYKENYWLLKYAVLK